MGNCCLPVRFRRSSSAMNPKSVTLLLVGLDNAGKTTIAKRLAEEPIDSVVPTVGFSVVSLRQKGCRVSLYDLGGGPQIRDIWHRYYADVHGVIFVVDASDVNRMEECHGVLNELLRHEEISGKPVLLLANKQDVDGALDEIDIVDHLNLERIVNEQKCPTLVELCSASHFTKKLDIGIDNGYKWLIRGIIRDYPALNNRVLRDLAKQEEESKVLMMKKRRKEENGKDVIGNHAGGDRYGSFWKPANRLLDEKSRMNGIEPFKVRSLPKIPGFVEVDQNSEKISGGRSQVSIGDSRTTSFSSEFFLLEKFQSDVELLNDVSKQTFKNFLVRPKSSGARLYGIRPEKRKATRRKAIIKTNKTGPSPFTNLSDDQNPAVGGPTQGSPPPRQYTPVEAFASPRIRSLHDAGTRKEDCNGNGSRRGSGKPFMGNGNPFLVTTGVDDRLQEDQEMRIFWEPKPQTKSTPNSRKNSGKSENAKRRRHSMEGSKLTTPDRLSKTEQVRPLKVNNRLNNAKEILLDVTQLKR